MVDSQQPQFTEYPDGAKYWYQNGVLHRPDGPALIEADGAKYWCLNDELILLSDFTQSTDFRQQILDFQRFATIYLVHNS